MADSKQSKREEELVKMVMDDHKSISSERGNWESHWDALAEVLWPNQKNTFRPNENVNTKGERKTESQLDSSPQIALGRFGAIMDSLLTPANQFWHGLRPSEDELAQDREVRLWFDKATKILFSKRRAPIANFSSQNQMMYKTLGSFGTGCLYTDEPGKGILGLRYKTVPLGECFIRENHQGIVDTNLRYFKLTARQAVQKYGELGTLPEDITKMAETKPDTEYRFMHLVKPREDFNPTRLDAVNRPFMSVTIAVKHQRLLKESGYNSFPYAIPRYDQAPGETYGRSPAMMAFPAIKTLMSQKKVVLKGGHRAVDPVLLIHDDGIIDGVSLRPGAMNMGGVNADGRPLVQTLPSGRVDIGLDMMNQEREIINDAFLVQLFQILAETPRMTATEVIERTREKGILLAPTVGRQQSEYLGPLINRELDLLAQQGLLPPMPDVLREAEGEYEVEYNSPLSRAMRAEEASGFIRTIETMIPVINTTGDPSPLDHIDMDKAVRELGDINAMPLSWTRTLEDVQAIREQRAEAQEREARAAEASGQAALMNAETKATTEGQ